MKLRLSLAAVSVLAATGCAISPPSPPSELSQEVRSTAEQRTRTPVVLQAPLRVEESALAYIPVTQRRVSESDWLRARRVSVEVGSQSVPLTEILRILSRQGLNITSEISLERFSYAGFPISNLDAETALRMVLSASGLDYHVDASRQLVIIRPMATRTWFLNIGNRRATFASGGAAAQGSEEGGQSGAGGAAGATVATGGTSTINTSDDFWASLRTELDARMQVLLPNVVNTAATPAPTAVSAASIASLPGFAPPAVPPLVVAGRTPATPASPATPAPAAPAPPAASRAEVQGFISQTVGAYSLNPETGAVTVQAPHWMLNDLDAYLKRIQDMYNTEIVFQGELLMLSTEATRTEGLDISSFARFANGRYGLLHQNNALGGVTVSIPTPVEGMPRNLVPSLAAGNTAIGGPLLGVRMAMDGLQLFNGYLSSMGRVTTLQRPVLTTTSGVPADFRRTVTRYFNTVSQQAAAGGAGGAAAVGTTNNLVPQEFGTILRVNPRIDMSTGLIRAQIELVQTTQVGTQTINQQLSTGDGVASVPTQVPVVSRILYSGEALLRDGDLVVMGGQTENRENATREGIPGLMDSGLAGGVFGKSASGSEKNVFFFALRVSTHKRR